MIITDPGIHVKDTTAFVK